jgi:Cu-Zn family superoxide dismutase
MIRTISLATALIATSACTGSSEMNAGSAPVGAGASTNLAAADGSVRGEAKFSEDAGGVVVQVEALGLAPGVHGIHVHAVGRCDAPDFASAGPHWNPTARQHGRQNPQGSHHGDMPNISIGADGRGTLRFTLPDARLAELFDADGAALVVHANADDERSDPSGNSGGRVACGVIERR